MKKDICPVSGNVCNTCNSWIVKNKNGLKYYSAVCKNNSGTYQPTRTICNSSNLKNINGTLICKD